MICLWRTVVAYKRSYNEMKLSTERDLNRLKAELNKANHTMQAACLNFASTQKSNETQAQVSVCIYTTFLLLSLYFYILTFERSLSLFRVDDRISKYTKKVTRRRHFVFIFDKLLSICTNKNAHLCLAFCSSSFSHPVSFLEYMYIFTFN